MNKCLFNVLFICHREIFLRFPDCNVPTKGHTRWSSFYYHWKAWLWFHQGTDRHAADKQRRKNCKVTFAAVLRIGANHWFHSSNFFRGHVHVGIEWRDFTGANISTLTSLLFFCILQYISFNLHQFSLHLFQCDCRWCVIYLQFVFIYFSSTSLSGGLCSVSAFGRVQVSSSDKKEVFPDRKDKIRSAVRLVWLKISFSKFHNYLAFFFTFFTEETGEEYLWKLNRVIKLILCTQLTLYGMKALSQFFSIFLLFQTTVAFRAASHQSKLMDSFSKRYCYNKQISRRVN